MLRYPTGLKQNLLDQGINRYLRITRQNVCSYSSLLAAANGSYSDEANVRLNVIQLSRPDIIASVRFPEEKRSGIQKFCREIGCLP